MAPDRDYNHSKNLALGNAGDLVQPNAMETHSASAEVGSSASSGSCSFQFFVKSEDGLNLTVDLNSDPLDWMRACSDGIRVPQHLHKVPKKSTLRSSLAAAVVGSARPRTIVGGGFLGAGRGLQGGSCNGSSGSGEVHSLQRGGINGPSSGECIGGGVPNLQVVPQPPRGMEEGWLVVPEASENGDVQGVRFFEGRAGDQYDLTCAVSAVERGQPGDVRMTDQVGSLNVSGQCQEPRDLQYVQAQESLQNNDGEIPRNSQVANTLEELNSNYSTEENLQDNPHTYKDEFKKAPVAKNLRILKNLARGPFIGRASGSSKSRRKSARLLAKVP